MNTIAITSPAPAKASLRDMLRRFGAQLRRAFELSGAPYMDGQMPPL
jgi:hypothetical protein